MYIISKSFHFSAAHHVPALKDGHPCKRMHGHNYEVHVEMSSETVNEAGFVRDIKDLDTFKRYIDDNFDHRLLNDVVGDDKVSTECLAKHFYDWCKARWPEVRAVRVQETPKIWAEYRESL